jgi:glycine cleavage system protein P-like pyridoxal-binding family
MLYNPNTLGIFETGLEMGSWALKSGLVYMDGEHERAWASRGRRRSADGRRCTQDLFRPGGGDLAPA